MKIRSLEEVCEQDNFSVKLEGNTYCRLKMGQKIGCKYQANEPDQNKIFPCLNPIYNDNDYKGKLIQ